MWSGSPIVVNMDPPGAVTPGLDLRVSGGWPTDLSFLIFGLSLSVFTPVPPSLSGSSSGVSTGVREVVRGAAFF